MSTYGHYDLKYIRTDRNGTKIYHDVNCPRCCGYGSLEQWAATGRICFACGGSGLRAKPKTVKIYTPEYAEKLEASRLERERKRLEENPPPSDEELKERADFARRNVWESEGLSRDGVGYAYFGETYPIKDKLKRAGAKWNSFLQGWIAPKPPLEIGLNLTALDVKCVKIRAEEYANEYGALDMDKLYDLRTGAGQEGRI